MLSIRKKITASQGENYYQEDNYYTQDDALKHSEWFGRGSAALGLSGQVEGEDFKSVLRGKSPGGKQLSAKKIDPDNHRAAIDLTFSAPKSLSIRALIGGDRRLIEAHRIAVQRTLAIAEERYAQSRVTTDGKREAVNTASLLVAQFHHDTSREKDPQTHTHCVVINATQLENGAWQSLHNDQLFNNKMILGQIYRNELALECQRLGYEIEQKEDGLFEIKGYSQQELDFFSKRSQQINDLVGENASSKEKERAALKTRAQKSELPFYQQKAQWEIEAESINLKHPQPVQPREITTTQSVDEAVATGIEHCSERDVSFKQEDVEKFILSEVGKHSFRDIQLAFDENQQLLRAIDGKFTTSSALQRELNTISLVRQAQGSVNAIAPREIVERHLENTTLNSGQQQGVIMALTTNDQFVAWQGVAGSGKTYALKEVKALAQAKGYQIKGFAPSADAAKVLEDDLDDSKVDCRTVASLLHSKLPEEVQHNQLWIVDEAGLLSAKDAHALLQRATAERARVILVGDTRQLSAVEAGNPFKSLQRAGIETAYLDESRRQKIEDLKEAVDLIAAGDSNAGIQRLKQGHPEKGSRIEIIQDRDERATRIKNDFMALSPGRRDRTLILAGTNAERLAIAETIRKALKAEGSLGTEVKIDRLKTKDLTSVQMRFTHHYKLGDVVMPLRDYKKLGLNKSELYAVVGKDQETLTLKGSNGSTKTVDPADFQKAVYERQKIEIAEGDRLRWTKNDRDLGRRNGQRFVVKKINQNQNSAVIEYASGKTEQIDLGTAQHLDHSLVSTIYSSQGKTAEQVIISASADRTLSKESFYVAVSRAKFDLKIYAEDETKLFEKAQESRAKENPIEALLEQQKQAKTELKECLAKLSFSGIIKEDKLNAEADKIEQQQSKGGLKL